MTKSAFALIFAVSTATSTAAGETIDVPLSWGARVEDPVGSGTFSRFARVPHARIRWLVTARGGRLELIRSPGRVPKHYATLDVLSQASNDVGVS